MTDEADATFMIKHDRAATLSEEHCRYRRGVPMLIPRAPKSQAVRRIPRLSISSRSDSDRPPQMP